MKNLERIRKQKKMSREELAYKSKVSYSAIVSFENGTRTPKITTAKSIAEVLNVSIEKLME